MNAQTQRRQIAGPAGELELAIDEPVGTAVGLALVAHPHPLFGGSLDNKVVQTMTRSLLARGLVCLRPNFRGVGASQGSHDHGHGEQEDLWAGWQWGEAEFGSRVGPQRWMGGFSFGAALSTHLAHQWTSRRQALGLAEQALGVNLLVGLAVERFEPAPIDNRARVIHGEKDDVVSLESVFRFCEAHDQPVYVLPGAGHFFHGALPSLRRLLDHALADV